METATAHRPWAPTMSPIHPQTLPSIRTLTRDVDNRASDKGTLSAASNMTPRDSASSWTGTTGIRKQSGSLLAVVD